MWVGFNRETKRTPTAVGGGGGFPKNAIHPCVCNYEKCSLVRFLAALRAVSSARREQPRAVLLVSDPAMLRPLAEAHLPHASQIRTLPPFLLWQKMHERGAQVPLQLGGQAPPFWPGKGGFRIEFQVLQCLSGAFASFLVPFLH